jgi:hypothetical protein
MNVRRCEKVPNYLLESGGLRELARGDGICGEAISSA